VACSTSDTSTPNHMRGAGTKHKRAIARAAADSFCLCRFVVRAHPLAGSPLCPFASLSSPLSVGVPRRHIDFGFKERAHPYDTDADPDTLGESVDTHTEAHAVPAGGAAASDSANSAPDRWTRFRGESMRRHYASKHIMRHEALSRPMISFPEYNFE
jgi:hypothetical protein